MMSRNISGQLVTHACHGSRGALKHAEVNRGIERVTRAIDNANPQIAESCKRFSQPANVHVNGPAFYSVRNWPNGLDELLAGTDLPLPFD
jgi:hypothetical protein